MTEAIISGVSMVLTLGAAVAVACIVCCVLTACEDIAAIKKHVCEEENDDGTEHKRGRLCCLPGIPTVPRGY